MNDNQIQPIHLVAQELAEKTIELASYKIAYEQVNSEYTKLKKIIDSNEEIKKLVEKSEGE
nr:MAG TPA: hypothetical protein [Caudoviricetes sp.]